MRTVCRETDGEATPLRVRHEGHPQSYADDADADHEPGRDPEDPILRLPRFRTDAVRKQRGTVPSRGTTRKQRRAVMSKSSIMEVVNYYK